MSKVTDEVEVTEIVELHAHKMSGVGGPANGTPFLLLKAAATKSDSAEADAQEEEMTGEGTSAKSSSAEADAQQELMTESAAKACGCVACEEFLKVEESSKAINDLPDSAFAHIEPGGKKDAEGKTTPRSKRHFPVHDKPHAQNALARAPQSPFGSKALPKIKAAAKKFGIKVSKGAVQEALNGTAKPQEAGHNAKPSESGTRGEVVTGTRQIHSDSSYTLGGETTSNIPDVTKVDSNSPIPPTSDGAGLFSGQPVTLVDDNRTPSLTKATAVASLIEAMDVLDSQRAAIKDGTYLQSLGITATEPAIPLSEVASTLASCCRTLDEHLVCERVEAAVDPSEQSDVWDMEDAKSALQCALKLVANIAVMESLENEGSATKAGKVLSAKNVAALEAAHKHLTGVIEAAQDKTVSDADTAKKETIDMQLSTSEFVASVQEIIKADRKAEKKARKAEEAKAAEEAVKDNVVTGKTGGTQSNNAGEVTESDVKPTKETKSDDVNAVKENEDGEVTKSDDEPDEFTKQVETQLEALTKGLAAVEQLVNKIAKRPRSGGPSLDGQARGTSPAAEGRLSDVTKGEGDEIEKLQKQLDEATDPIQKSHISMLLTRANLTKAHEEGRV